jgi:hypothetical protein
MIARASKSTSWGGVLAAAAAAMVLALAIKSLAEAAGFGRALFGFGVGVSVADFLATPTRSALYPLFIEATRPLGPLGIAAIQTFLYFLAGIALFARLLPPRRWAHALAALAGAAALLNPRVLEYPLSISEEGLFLPALLGLMAALLAHLERPRAATAAAAGLLAGLAFGIRPIGIAFVPMLAGGIVLAAFTAPAAGRWTRCLPALVAAALAFAAAEALERLAYRALAGGEARTSVLGINLVAKLPFILERGDLRAAATVEEAPAIERVEAALLRSAEFVRAADAALQRWDARQFLTNYLEFEFQLRGPNPALVAAIGQLAARRGRPPSTVAAEVSFAVIRARPLRFAARVAGNFARFLALAEFPTAAGRREAEALPERLGRAPFAAAVGDGFRPALEAAAAYRLPAWVLRLAHAVALAAILASLVLALAAALRRRALAVDAAFALTAGLGFLGYFLACALVINVQVRYVLTVWPLTVALGLLLLAMALRRARRCVG